MPRGHHGGHVVSGLRTIVDHDHELRRPDLRFEGPQASCQRVRSVSRRHDHGHPRLVWAHESPATASTAAAPSSDPALSHPLAAPGRSRRDTTSPAAMPASAARVPPSAPQAGTATRPTATNAAAAATPLARATSGRRRRAAAWTSRLPSGARTMMAEHRSERGDRVAVALAEHRRHELVEPDRHQQHEREQDSEQDGGQPVQHGLGTRAGRLGTGQVRERDGERLEHGVGHPQTEARGQGRVAGLG